MCLDIMSVFCRNLLKSLQLHWRSTFHYTDKRRHPVYACWNVVPFQTLTKKMGEKMMIFYQKLSKRETRVLICSLLTCLQWSGIRTESDLKPIIKFESSTLREIQLLEASLVPCRMTCATRSQSQELNQGTPWKDGGILGWAFGLAVKVACVPF